MADYIRQLSWWEIARASFSIYLANWRPIVAIYVPALLPILAVETWFQIQGSLGAAAICFFLQIILSVFTTAALTIVIADLCLGRPISVGRCWRFAFGRAGARLIVTFLLATLFTIIGFVFLIIP